MDYYDLVHLHMDYLCIHERCDPSLFSTQRGDSVVRVSSEVIVVFNWFTIRQAVRKIVRAPRPLIRRCPVDRLPVIV